MKYLALLIAFLFIVSCSSLNDVPVEEDNEVRPSPSRESGGGSREVAKKTVKRKL